MVGLAHQAHQSQPIQRTISLYQERMYYFFKKLMGLSWYILLGMAGPANVLSPLQLTGSGTLSSVPRNAFDSGTGRVYQETL
jgi:hypothetical protein